MNFFFLSRFFEFANLLPLCNEFPEKLQKKNVVALSFFLYLGYLNCFLFFILFSFCAHHEFCVKPQQPVEEKNSKNVKKYDDEEIHFSIFPGNI
jgi:hypothetical protein